MHIKVHSYHRLTDRNVLVVMSIEHIRLGHHYWGPPVWSKDWPGDSHWQDVLRVKWAHCHVKVSSGRDATQCQLTIHLCSSARSYLHRANVKLITKRLYFISTSRVVTSRSHETFLVSRSVLERDIREPPSHSASCHSLSEEEHYLLDSLSRHDQLYLMY